MDSPTTPARTRSRWRRRITGVVVTLVFAGSAWITAYMSWQVLRADGHDMFNAAIMAFGFAVVPFCVMFVVDVTRHPDDPWRLSAGLIRVGLYTVIGAYGWSVYDYFHDRGVDSDDALGGAVLFTTVAWAGAMLLSGWLVDGFHRRRLVPPPDDTDPTVL